MRGAATAERGCHRRAAACCSLDARAARPLGGHSYHGSSTSPVPTAGFDLDRTSIESEVSMFERRTHQYPTQFHRLLQSERCPNLFMPCQADRAQSGTAPRSDHACTRLSGIRRPPRLR